MAKLFRREERRLLKPDPRFGKQLKEVLGFKPRKIGLYYLAFIHKSSAHKLFGSSDLNNERLEFLGDAVLDAIVAELLYIKFPDGDEGFLTKMRSKIVNRETLKRIAIKLGIDKMLVSRMTNDNHASIFGDALEALIGALYLDKGYGRTKKFVLERIVDHHINLLKLSQLEIDFKSRIIEWGQKHKKEIHFSCHETENNKGKTPIFKSFLLIEGEEAGSGLGKSKKEAEQHAAQTALANKENFL